MESVTPQRSMLKVIFTGIIIAIIIMALVVVIINFTDYQKVIADKPISKGRANTMYYLNIVLIVLLVMMLIYSFYMMYRELYPANVALLKIQAQGYYDAAAAQASALKGQAQGYYDTAATQVRALPTQARTQYDIIGSRVGELGNQAKQNVINTQRGAAQFVAPSGYTLVANNQLPTSTPLIVDPGRLPQRMAPVPK